MEKTLSGFMKENAIEIKPVEYVASKRFVQKDENGKVEPIKWELKALASERFEELRRRSKKRVPIKGTSETKIEFDNEGFLEKVTLETIVFPNLNDESLQENYGVVGAAELAKAMLTAGEWADLQTACLEANDYEVGMKDKIEKVKN